MQQDQTGNKYCLDDLLGADLPPAPPAPGATPNLPPAGVIESTEAIPAIMSEGEMATFLGMSATRVRELARNGVLIRPDRGRYDVRASVKRYAERMREQAAKAGNPATGDAEALKAEKLRLTRAQADKEEARARRESGELVEAAAVQREWSNLLRDTRNALLAVPSRCGAALPHLTATDVATLDREIKKALEGLADGN